MRIWVDADAFPNAVKSIVFRASERTSTPVTLVANQALSVPRGGLITAVRVERGFDVADGYIAARVQPGDLVITADIPLAAEVVARGALALNPRGELYDEENVRERLATRDLMDQLRSTGELGGGPPPIGKAERQRFANQLDRLLARRGGDGSR